MIRKLKSGEYRLYSVKKDPKTGGKLEFGTEIVAAEDGSIAALLGASPGASVSVSAMLDLIRRCFPTRIDSAGWGERLAQMFPAMAADLERDAELYRATQARSNAILGLASA